jgi:acetyl-CoA acetyltransferase
MATAARTTIVEVGRIVEIGAIAMGHPLGASGGRILGTLAKVLVERGERWGVAAICIGVGQGLAVVLENLRLGSR